MNKKVQIHQFDPVIYPLKLWVAKNPTKEAISERFEEHNGNEVNAEFTKYSVASTYNTVIVSTILFMTNEYK